MSVLGVSAEHEIRPAGQLVRPGRQALHFSWNLGQQFGLTGFDPARFGEQKKDRIDPNGYETKGVARPYR